jgi:alpha-beta hydrolase superfamily lysophospholipase
MDWLAEALGSLTVEQRAMLGAAVFAALFAVAVGLTALVLSFRRALLLWIGFTGAAIAWALLMPVDTDGLRAEPRPEPTYAAAVARFEAEKAAETEPLNPLCDPVLLGHGETTGVAVVLLHGVSSCPRAFVDFAPLLHERGHNVLVMRMPYNGFADRSTDALRNITAEALADFGDTSVDIAAGLGEEVVVLGISAGGTVAAWTAQNRPEVSRAVLVAPFFGLADFGPRLNVALMRGMLLLPDVSIWKDPVLRDRHVGMAHAYQRQSTRATAEIMRLGLATYREATEAAPAAPVAAFVTNAADTAVSNGVTAVIADVWEAGGMKVTRYEFGAEHGLGHELIDPEEPGADPALTYPVILRAVEDPAALAALPPG